MTNLTRTSRDIDPRQISAPSLRQRSRESSRMGYRLGLFVGAEMLEIYPLVMTNIAIENGHRNSEFSHEKW